MSENRIKRSFEINFCNVRNRRRIHAGYKFTPYTIEGYARKREQSGSTQKIYREKVKRERRQWFKQFNQIDTRLLKKMSKLIPPVSQNGIFRSYDATTHTFFSGATEIIKFLKNKLREYDAVVILEPKKILSKVNRNVGVTLENVSEISGAGESASNLSLTRYVTDIDYRNYALFPHWINKPLRVPDTVIFKGFQYLVDFIRENYYESLYSEEINTEINEIAKYMTNKMYYKGMLYEVRFFMSPEFFNTAIYDYVVHNKIILTPVEILNFPTWGSRGVGHLNSIVINPFLKTIEYYEPHGFKKKAIDLRNHYYFINNYATRFFNNVRCLSEYQFIYIPFYFQYSGPQGPYKRVSGYYQEYPDQYCTIHSTLFMYFRSLFINVPLDKFLQNFYSLDYFTNIDWVDIVIAFATEIDLI